MCMVLDDTVTIVLALAPCEFPEPPLQSVRPVYQVEMANSDQGALVVTPSTRLNTDQPIVESFGAFDDGM